MKASYGFRVTPVCHNRETFQIKLARCREVWDNAEKSSLSSYIFKNDSW